MYTVNAFALVTSPTTPQASVASMIMPESPAALGRLPLQSVHSALSYANIQNNRQGSAFTPAGAETGAAANPAAANPAMGASAEAARMADVHISSFPSLFLAQLIGQGMNEQTRGLVVSYETMQQFSQVKYLPSNATKPPQPSPALDFLKSLHTEQQVQAAANANVKAAVAANTSAPVAVSQNLQEEVSSLASLVRAVQPAEISSAAGAKNNPPRKAYLREGAAAYAHTVRHNASILLEDRESALAEA